MRTTHVITRMIVGGAQENTLATLRGLQALPDVQADLISGIETGTEGSLANQLEKSSVTWLPELVRNLHPGKDFLALKKLKQRFVETRPDIVHTHSGKAGFLGRMAAHKAGVPIIVHTIHGPSFGAFQNGFANVLFRSAERRAGRVTTQFISVADAMSRQYLAAGIGRKDQYSCIHSGFDLQPFLNAKNDVALRLKLGIEPDDIVIGKIARLFRLKGHEDLIQVAQHVVARNPRVKFLLIGDGPLRGQLEQQIRQRRLEGNVILAGLIAPEDIAQYVGVMDMLIHLSLREGLARALPQALAAGKPIVAYDCDGAGEVCINNKTGYLVPAGDIQRATESLLLLVNAPELRIKLGEAGKELVKNTFTKEAMVNAIYKLYLRLLSTASKG